MYMTMLMATFVDSMVEVVSPVVDHMTMWISTVIDSMTRVLSPFAKHTTRIDLLLRRPYDEGHFRLHRKRDEG